MTCSSTHPWTEPAAGGIPREEAECASEWQLESGSPADAPLFKWAPKDKPPRYGPGLRGQALGVGPQVDVSAEGNILPGSGTMSCWFWYKGNIRNLGTIFKLGGMYIKGDHGLLYGATSRTRLGSAADWPGRPLRLLAFTAISRLRRGTMWRWHGKGNGLTPISTDARWIRFWFPEAEVFAGPWFGIGDEGYANGEDIGSHGLVDEMMSFAARCLPRRSRTYRHALDKEPVPVEARHTRVEPCLGQGKLILTVDQEMAGITPGENLVARLL